MNSNSFQSSGIQDSSSPQAETPQQRVMRLHLSRGGPLIGWLIDECRRRGHDYQAMAAQLGVTYGYISQMRNGTRSTSQISDEFARACSRYLGVPAVVVKVIAGRLPMSDFACPEETDIFLERAISQMFDDPAVRCLLPVNPHELPRTAKEALVSLYTEATGREVLGLQRLPEMVRWLQRAAVIHDEQEGLALRELHEA